MSCEEFDSCHKTCREKGEHTLVYGQCEFGQRPEPTLDFFSVKTAQDGYPMGYYTPIKASVFLPWLQQLPVNEQHKLLERVASAKPDKQRAVLERERNSWIDE